MARLGQHLQEADRTMSIFRTQLASPGAKVSFEKTLHECCTEDLCLSLKHTDRCPKAIKKPTRGRQRKYTDLYLARLARDYVKIIQKTKTRRPVADLARKRKLAESQTRSLIHTARKRGILLPRGIQGQNRAGWLSDYAEELLSRPKKPKTKSRRRIQDAKKG
jgi:hypothetical protein